MADTEVGDDPKLELFDQIMEFGYSAKEAQDLVEFKDNIGFDNVDRIRSSFSIAKMIPTRFIPDWDNLSEYKRRGKLRELGINTKLRNYVEDVCCYTWNEKRECGRVVWGEERRDKPWLTLVIDGRNVASEEARYFKDMETLQVMRGNKR